MFCVEGQAALRVEAFTKSVDWARPNVAEHYPERGDAQPG